MTTLSSSRVEPPHRLGSQPPEDERRFGEAVLIILLMVGLIVATTIFLIPSSGPSYTATVTHIATVDSSTVVATIQVWNVRDHPERPTCDIELNSSAGAFTGAGSMTANEPIAAGRQATYEVGVPVTTNGATMIDLKSSTVSCH